MSRNVRNGSKADRPKTTFLQARACGLRWRMSPPRLDKSTLPDTSYQWTTRKAAVFLGALAHFGRVGEAARVVGMCRQSAYRLRARLGEDGLFAKAWDEAQAKGRARRRWGPSKATVLPPESDVFGIGK